MPILTIWVMVKVFIDESGSFVSLPDGTLCMVGALILPDQNYKFIEKLYLKLRSRLPKENGEVKGRHLDEEQINLVVDLLRRNQAILEINAVDLKIQSEHDLEKYRTRHLARQSESLHEFKGNAIAKVIASNQQIAETSLQLYLQALMVTHLLHRVVNTSTLYFSQRQPKELNNFSWIVDGKDKQRITKWETWLEWFSKGAISTMSKTKPFMRLIEGDYLHFGKYDLKDSDGANIGIDIKALFQDFRYSSSPEIGLELVDIVVTATRRALVGNLNATGFNKISSLMIHHRDEYIKFLVFKPDGINITQQTSYGSVVQKYFMSGGRSMVPLSYFEDN